MSRANCCEVCDSTSPKWVIVRQGDVVVSWGCDYHLATVCDRLQRDFELTRLIVRLWAKSIEVAEINRSIREAMPSMIGKEPL